MATEVVKSVGRVIEVLEFFRDGQSQASATEICDTLGYPNSSADALLKSLVSLGYLTFDTQSRRYFPTLRVTRLGDWIPNQLFSDGTTAMLESLHESTGETVTLSMQNDLHMQFVRVLPGTFPISLRVSEGYLGPLFGTAVGEAFLSQLNDRQIQRLLQRARRTPGSVAGRMRLSAVIEEVGRTRELGYAVAYDRILPDTGAVAMPLPGNSSFVVAVGGLASRIHLSEKAIIRLMRRAIRELDLAA
ncbi:MAG: helix-turn-helix domain-containing protein [Pseudomonadota bacterium]